MPPPRVCLLGAGASGIAAARALAARGLEFDWFEAREKIGGVWALGEDGRSSAYERLHINVSRTRIEFADRPLGAELPQYPHHTQLARYFEDYVRHFGLDRRLRLGCEVRRASRGPGGGWEIELSDGGAGRYGALVVANGHHAVPRWPDPAPPGSFAGAQMHSHDYVDDTVLRGRDVVVVGLGNSACDIAVEASMAGREVQLSVRRGAHVLPKTMWRWPYDRVPGLEYALGRGVGIGRHGVQLPWSVRQAWLAAGHRLNVGRSELYGLPRPRHSFGATHPTISPRLLDRLLHGEIAVKPEIERLDGELVHFADGSAARAELIVWCTGYEIEFPFLPAGLSPLGEQNRVDAYWNVFSPRAPGLAFVGLLQPAGGSTMQISELQAGWVAAHLAGEYALPGRAEMEAEIARRRRRQSGRVVRTARHTVQVEQFDFAWRLRAELHRGRRRARQGA